ncbi:MAG TPA: hypothetical protein ENF65_00115 [Euryarchaeota archaeon]|nr:MAG: hypothetical protein DRN46_04320 [Thermococci archaeon]HDI10134.1 hypothetical protein [Euryarchaeota archaeon]
MDRSEALLILLGILLGTLSGLISWLGYYPSIPLLIFMFSVYLLLKLREVGKLEFKGTSLGTTLIFWLLFWILVYNVLEYPELFWR